MQPVTKRNGARANRSVADLRGRPSMPPQSSGKARRWDRPKFRRLLSLLFQQLRDKFLEVRTPLDAADNPLPVDHEHRGDLVDVVLLRYRVPAGLGRVEHLRPDDALVL